MLQDRSEAVRRNGRRTSKKRVRRAASSDAAQPRSASSAKKRPPTRPAAGAFQLDQRSAGVLLHVTSLPGPHGNGDIGAAARRFIDFLAAAGQRWWQMLPVNPAGQGNSPYSGVSAYAGNPLLVSLDDLVEDGLLDPADVAFKLPATRADYARAEPLRTAALRQAFARHRQKPQRLARALARFQTESAHWLPDYALYMALRRSLGGKRWTEWPRDLARRQPAALTRARAKLANEVAYYEFEQFVFNRQWVRLREYGQARGVGLIGDAPIFIAHESADVWSSSRLFLLDEHGEPTHVAGVPPDYFCTTGQRWGNPLYRWDALKRAHYDWWVERFRTLLQHFDVIRLDHFIGFSRYWQVPAAEKTAENGSWEPGPGLGLFEAVRAALGTTPFIAEDLGEVTAEVRKLRDDLGLPGMRVLQFAFGSDLQANDFLPHRYIPNAIAYTGTHDNDTFAGWFHDKGGRSGPRSARQASQERRAAIAYLAGPQARTLPAQVHWEGIRAVYASVARTAIIPMQDLLGLGNESRMNMPGSAEGNWEWRVQARDLSPKLGQTLRDFTSTYGRLLAE
jgi:4-alpha-glucanotransferase